MMIVLGLVLIAHGLLNLAAALMGASGYIKRNMSSDAAGVLLTIGVAAVAEIAFGVFLVW
jgi:hypothetical protein